MRDKYDSGPYYGIIIERGVRGILKLAFYQTLGRGFGFIMFGTSYKRSLCVSNSSCRANNKFHIVENLC